MKGPNAKRISDSHHTSRGRPSVCILAHSNASATLERQRVSTDEAAALSREAFRQELEVLHAREYSSRQDSGKEGPASVARNYKAFGRNEGYQAQEPQELGQVGHSAFFDDLMIFDSYLYWLIATAFIICVL